MSRAMWVVLGALLSTSLAAVPAVATDGKAVWAPLIQKGAAALTATVVKGKGAMPPKGGAASEADVKAAVEYIISQMQ